MEVCVDSLSSARNAEAGGAIRLELCANLVEGGTTPSCGMLRVIKQHISLPVFVMIRPRGGDFLFSPDEFAVMREDILTLKTAGADGFVFGILKADGTVDSERCKELVAIDMTRDIDAAVESVIRMGFERILTSGGECDVITGISVLKNLTAKTKGQVIIVPGGGIRADNLGEILETTGAVEFHGTARSGIESRMEFRKTRVKMGVAVPGLSEFAWKETSVDNVREMVRIAKEHGVCTNTSINFVR